MLNSTDLPSLTSLQNVHQLCGDVVMLPADSVFIVQLLLVHGADLERKKFQGEIELRSH